MGTQGTKEVKEEGWTMGKRGGRISLEWLLGRRKMGLEMYGGGTAFRKEEEKIHEYLHTSHP